MTSRPLTTTLALTGVALRVVFTCCVLGAVGCGSDEDDAPSTPAPPLPELESASPTNDAADVPRTAWLILRFVSEIDVASMRGFRLDCGEGTPRFATDLVGTSTVVINPDAELPPGASCKLAWRSSAGAQSLAFDVAGKGEPAVIAYDRSDKSKATPFPDDAWLVDDASTKTGKRVALPTLDRPTDVQEILGALLEATKTLDGWSPLAPWVVSLPAAPDEASLPLDEAGSLDPFATVGLFDVADGQRIPFDLLVQNQTSADGSPAHDLVIFPSRPLDGGGRYVLVVTRRALIDPTRPLEASSAFGSSEPTPGILSMLEQTSPPIRTDDVAVAVQASIRSTDDIPKDLLSIRSQLEALPRPTFTVTDTQADTTAGSAVAAIVTGTFTAPSFREGAFVNRAADGTPLQNGSVDIPFVLALPKAAESAAVPLVMYQHGNPGSAENEVARNEWGLAAAGFAVIGFARSSYDWGSGSSPWACFQNHCNFRQFPMQGCTPLSAGGVREIEAGTRS